MKGSPLDEHLDGRRPRAVALVIALDEAIHAAQPELDVAAKYKMLMYALRGDWRHWGLRDRRDEQERLPARLIRRPARRPARHPDAGSSVLKTWDFGFDDPVDRAAVGAYVSEAVARYAECKTNTA